MRIVDFIVDKSNDAINYSEDYIKSSEKYFKLKFFEQYSLTLSLLVKLAIITAFLFMAIMFLCFSAAIALGTLFNNLALGYLTIGVVFILLTILVFSLRRKIDNKVIQSLSNNFFSANENEE